tara:strand:+ start:195372 stop:196349 length:978 start_codon:yes stop_codon:yes gene_type:complete
MSALSRRVSGFTLLEVLLTLSMSIVLMLLIGGAIQFYGRDMAVSDLEARQTQLAAAIMQMIEDDMRATQHADPVDTSGLESLFSSLGTQAAGTVQGGGGDGGTDTTTTVEFPEDTTIDTDMATTDLTMGAAVLEEPGLIGNQFQIQIDVSRMPRLEEYYVMYDALTGNIDDVPSEMKTVTYYVQPPGTTGGVADPLASVGNESSELAGGGLVRRSLDRGATKYASLNGSLASLNQTGELLAPEVTGLEFSYWDGVTWQLEWSSDEYGELPLAVQVTLSMVDPVAASAAADPQTAVRTFQHVIRLPMAKPIEEEEEEDAAMAEAGI